MNPLESKKSVWLCMRSKEFLVIFGQEAERLLLCIKLGTIGIYDSYTGRIRLLGKVFFDFA